MFLVLNEGAGGLQHLNMAEHAEEILRVFATVVTTEVTATSVHCIFFFFAYSSLTYISRNQLCLKNPTLYHFYMRGFRGQLHVQLCWQI